jgi:hypothetical protein
MSCAVDDNAPAICVAIFMAPAIATVGSSMPGENDISGTHDRQHLVDDLFDQHACVDTVGDLTVFRLAQRGNRIQSAIPNKLGPESTLDVAGNSAGNGGADEESCEFLCLFAFGPDHQVASGVVLQAAGCLHRRSNVNSGRQRIDVRSCANLFDVVNAILQTDQSCIRREEGRQFAGRRGAVRCFHAEKISAAPWAALSSVEASTRTTLLKVQSVEKESGILNRFNK